MNLLFSRLAISGLKKNKTLVRPFMITAIGMVVMYYIVSFLSECSALASMSNGMIVQYSLKLGSWVLIVFSLFFLFYANSFLIKRRKKEFGLYNILGLRKQDICKVLFVETSIICLIVLSVGLVVGIALSKLGELALVNIIRGSVGFRFEILWSSVLKTIAFFAVIFLLIFVDSVIKIHFSSTIDLLHSQAYGEKPPKANFLIGFLVLALLAIAYYIAVTITEPIKALFLFFVAVILVIVATYLLFIVGSVVFCKMLSKNKKYYYNPKHFVSTSSLVFRMKRNGAGLASICILATMVLVMISSSACLYFGAEDSLKGNYPRDLALSATLKEEGIADQSYQNVKEIFDEFNEKNQIEANDGLFYRSTQAAFVKDGENFGYDDTEDSNLINMCALKLFDLRDYNEILGKDIQLEKNQALVYSNGKIDFEELKINNGDLSYQVQKIDSFFESVAQTGFTFYFVVISDFANDSQKFVEFAKTRAGNETTIDVYYGVDLNCEKEREIELFGDLKNEMSELKNKDELGISAVKVVSREFNRSEFYGTYGALFFLGIVLSIAFIFATILIIYYKQLSEGYEDKYRFEIMQKIGMTKKDIKKCVNSQMLTIFFFPLILAVVHLAFSFPMIEKVLLLFHFANLPLFLLTTAISVIVFSLIYMAVYKLTANTYFSIVSGKTSEENE